MAILKTNEMKGLYPTPIVDGMGEIVEVTIKWDTTLTADGAFASGDILQIMQLPANTVLVGLDVVPSATFGTTTFDVGIATSSSASTIATSLTSGVLTAERSATRRNLLNVVPKAAPTADENIIAALAGVANAAANQQIYFIVRYRAVRYGL